MPNYCENNITISHPDEDVMRPLIQSIKDEALCQYVLPIPPCPHDDLFKKNDWEYDFCCHGWGTKWDIGDVKIMETTSSSITFACLTAWAPPHRIFEILTKRGFKVNAYYFEGGCGILGMYESATGFRDFEFGDKTELLKQMSKDVYDKFQEAFYFDSEKAWDEEEEEEEKKDDERQEDVIPEKRSQQMEWLHSFTSKFTSNYIAKKTYIEENYNS